MTPRRGDGPSRAGKSSAAQRQSILVFTEGKKTEPVYLTHWHRMYRERVIVTVDEFHGAPLQLVETAAASAPLISVPPSAGRGMPTTSTGACSTSTSIRMWTRHCNSPLRHRSASRSPTRASNFGSCFTSRTRPPTCTGTRPRRSRLTCSAARRCQLPPHLSSSSAAMRMPGGAHRHLTASTRWTAHRHDPTQAAVCGASSMRSGGPDTQEGNGETALSWGGLRNWPDR